MEKVSSLTYPTKYLRPVKMDRLVREVAFEEMKRLTSYRVKPDVLGTCIAVRVIAYTYKRLGYNLPELLCSFQDIHLTEQKREESSGKLTPDLIPWEIVPQDILERCLDSNMELTVTDELREFLNFKPSSSIFDKTEFPSRWVSSKSSSNLIASPVYDKSGRRRCTEYYIFDESIGEFRRAIIKNRGSFKTSEELEYVVDRFGPGSPEYDEVTGIRSSLLLKTIHSLEDCIAEYRKRYFRHQFIDEFKYKTIEQLHREREAAEREYAVSRAGHFTEDTSTLWRLVKDGD